MNPADLGPEFGMWLDGLAKWAAGTPQGLPGWRSAAGLGLHSLPVARQHGGTGAGYLAASRAFELAARESGAGGLLFSIAAHMWACQEPLAAFGDAKQHGDHLPGMLSGTLVGAFAATEPEAGSDVLSMRTRAVELPDGSWRLDGAKAFVSNAPWAHLFLVLARTSDDDSFAALSAFLIPRGTTGLTVGPATTVSGPDGSCLAPLHLDRVEVGASACLGGTGAGFAVLLHAMRYERALILAPTLGLMERALGRAVDHVRTRVQFGQPLATYDAVRRRLVAAQLCLTSAREVLWNSAELADRGRLGHDRAALTKLHVSRQFNEFASVIADVYGGYAMTPETGSTALLQSALASRFYSGTDDMQIKIIAEGLGL